MAERQSVEEAQWIKHGHPTKERRQLLGKLAAVFLLASFLIPVLIALVPVPR